MKAEKILETCLYVNDLERAKEFYTRVLGLEFHAEVPGRHIFFRCGDSMFLLFDPSATSQPHPGMEVPLHGATGPGHCCFTLTESNLESWRSHLHKQGVSIEQEIVWPQGGVSLYFRDPDGNSLELASRRVWGFKD